MAFSKTSKKRLADVDPALQHIMNMAIIEFKDKDYDFGIAAGIRTLEEQRKYLKEGKSQTKNSRHLHGFACDIYRWCKIDKKAVWDLNEIRPIAELIKEIANDNGTPVVWGGDWYHFKDAPHFQLSYVQFPDKPEVIAAIKAFDWS